METELKVVFNSRTETKTITLNQSTNVYDIIFGGFGGITIIDSSFASKTNPQGIQWFWSQIYQLGFDLYLADFFYSIWIGIVIKNRIFGFKVELKKEGSIINN